MMQTVRPEFDLGPDAPPVIHRSSDPVFVIGHARSGTSVFVRMLRKYLRIAFGTESQFIVRYYQGLHRYGDLTDCSNLRRLVEDICGERWFARCDHRFGGFRTSPEAILADVTVPTYAGVLDAVFRQLAKELGMPRWGDKTPEYLHHLGVLYELFPQARFIHVVRDGRAVALSGFEQPFGEKNIVTAAVAWVDSIRKVREFAARIPEAQLLEVRYMDFVKEPARCFERILPFLEIDGCEGRLAEFIAKSASSELDASRVGRWRRRLSAREIQRFDEIAGDVLSEYGFATSVAGGKQISSLALRYWQCDNLVRRVVDPRYIGDTLYRVKLRVKDRLRGLKRRTSTGT